MSGFLSFSKLPGHIMMSQTVQCLQLQEIQKMVLNSRKLLKTKKLKVSWKIQNAIKSERKEELGWNYQDLLISVIFANGQNLKQIGGYQFQTLGEVDWTDPIEILFVLW